MLAPLNNHWDTSKEQDLLSELLFGVAKPKRKRKTKKTEKKLGLVGVSDCKKLNNTDLVSNGDKCPTNKYLEEPSLDADMMVKKTRRKKKKVRKITNEMVKEPDKLLTVVCKEDNVVSSNDHIIETEINNDTGLEKLILNKKRRKRKKGALDVLPDGIVKEELDKSLIAKVNKTVSNKDCTKTELDSDLGLEKSKVNKRKKKKRKEAFCPPGAIPDGMIKEGPDKSSIICKDDKMVSNNDCTMTELDSNKTPEEKSKKNPKKKKRKKESTHHVDVIPDRKEEEEPDDKSLAVTCKEEKIVSSNEYIKNDVDSSDTGHVKLKLNKKKKKRKKGTLHPLNLIPSCYAHEGENDFNEKDQRKINDSIDTLALAPPSKKMKQYDVSKYNKFQSKLVEKLKGGQFRWINEKLYSCESSDAANMFVSDPELFSVYHNGFHAQIQQWPENPVDVIIQYIKARDSKVVVADFGCGDAKLAASVPNEVHSFDLVAVNDRVTACDMRKVPLPGNSIDIAVFCLSLMGTNLVDFLVEAHRVTKIGGILKIAEVKSRFDDIDKFNQDISSIGFSLVEKDDSNKMFILLEFLKNKETHCKRVSNIVLNPCIYKRR